MSVMEEWRSVRGYEGLYEVSDLGRLRALAKERIMPHGGVRIYPQKIMVGTVVNGHLMVSLHRNSIRTRKYIHQLVLEAFIGPQERGMHSCHKDGNGKNNRLGNLRWDTPKNNKADDLPNGVLPHSENHSMAKLSNKQVLQIRERMAAGESGLKVAKEFGVTHTLIYAIKNRRLWRHL